MDLNSDGHIDILSGSYSRMGNPMAGTLQVLWGETDRKFKKAVELKGTDNNPLIIPPAEKDGDLDSICTRPMAVDWDCDGDLDLIVGNFAGGFHLFTGEGGGKFAPKPSVIKAESKPLRLTSGKFAGHHGDPFLVDWDGDGDLDLLSGSAGGGVQWAQNTAGPKKTPVLKPFAWLISAPVEIMHECRPNEVTEPAGSTRVWVADVNGDKKLDILVGDCINLISPIEGMSEEKFAKRYAEWKQAQKALFENPEPVKKKSLFESLFSNSSRSAKDEADFQDKIRANYEERKQFMSEDHTGFVWVYLQK